MIEPLFESLPDHTIMLAFARKLGFGNEFVKNIRVTKGKLGFDEPVMEDMTREINAGNWTIGYTGQSPERLKAHMRLMGHFDPRTLRCTESVVDKETGYDIKGDYFGMPWPCYGTPAVKHPGSPILYRTDLKMMDGGGASAPTSASPRTARSCSRPTARTPRIPRSPPDSRSSTMCS